MKQKETKTSQIALVDGEKLSITDSFASLFTLDEEEENDSVDNEEIKLTKEKHEKLLLLFWLHCKFPNGLEWLHSSSDLLPEQVSEWFNFYQKYRFKRGRNFNLSARESVTPIVEEPIVPEEPDNLEGVSEETPLKETSLELSEEEIITSKSPIPSPETIHKNIDVEEKETIEPTTPVKEVETTAHAEEEKGPLTPDSEYAARQLTEELANKSSQEEGVDKQLRVVEATEKEHEEDGNEENVTVTKPVEVATDQVESKEVKKKEVSETTEPTAPPVTVAEVLEIEDKVPKVDEVEEVHSPEAKVTENDVENVQSGIDIEKTIQLLNNQEIPSEQQIISVDKATESPVQEVAVDVNEKPVDEIVEPSKLQMENKLPSEKSPTIDRTGVEAPLFELSVSMPLTLIPPSKFSEPVKPELSSEAWLLRTEMSPLHLRLKNAHKYVLSDNWSHAYREEIVRQSLHHLTVAKEKGIWSFRQPKRQNEMPRLKTHRDYVLDEMQWMSIDFSQERKWKIILAHRMANWVMDYHQASDKCTVCTPASLSKNKKPYMQENEHQKDSHEETFNEQIVSHFNLNDNNNNKVLSIPRDSLQFYNAVFSDDIFVTTNSEQIQNCVLNVPMYGPPTENNEYCEEISEKYPITPVSRFAYAKTKLKSTCAKASRKRLFNQLELSPPESFMEKKARSDENQLDGNKIKDDNQKLSSVGTFSVRPPYPPSSKDIRPEAPWLPEEDELLLLLLRRYSFNWEFVASRLTPPGLYIPLAEKRTAWDCFERWIQVDPRAANVQLTGSHARLAQQKLDESLRHSDKVSQHLSLRDEGTPNHLIKHNSYFLLPTVSRHYRPITIFEAIRKILKKREFAKKPTMTKRAIAPSAASTEKLPPVPSPLELSRLKSEREAQIQQIQAQRNFAQLQSQNRALRPQNAAVAAGAQQHNQQLAAFQAVAASQNSSNNSSAGVSPIAGRMVPRLQPYAVSSSLKLTPEQIHQLQQRKQTVPTTERTQ
ncbi:NuA4 histone acetyltransferase complex scaffold subunit Vid21/Eaf1 [Schizosaccharomyces pombe]|uniref:Chromatin modification-related protein vid21 n=1 Tax=Schizosaccharomyces pombe (strain 972 / ATCC 24843) TaxID=284812 RepID=EAF_SCHPO|nr:NuA4 histone acetyltransferase complex subunit Vid21 [Schizosaccharomyces pombe]O59773.2 RecName: Full=Chromatin modification-related protein vid21; AltName: Full=Esa1-associated factor vid21; AltName: Full=Vacuolar import and degradation protein 21 [Schizosaccharomyces pombe 972h-]CAA18643.2 NuA4 histone acetyltransferase complex subunit Vid21 [Schizosaccharomyces pombe]|eukprot:NP_588036.2 NuA4 histone acetyltransferase complex subunit Vid21 [Schizosaccharomyces pombe]